MTLPVIAFCSRGREWCSINLALQGHRPHVEPIFILDWQLAYLMYIQALITLFSDSKTTFISYLLRLWPSTVAAPADHDRLQHVDL